jgi:hypothetical protein
MAGAAGRPTAGRRRPRADRSSATGPKCKGRRGPCRWPRAAGSGHATSGVVFDVCHLAIDPNRRWPPSAPSTPSIPFWPCIQSAPSAPAGPADPRSGDALRPSSPGAWLTCRRLDVLEPSARLSHGRSPHLRIDWLVRPSTVMEAPVAPRDHKRPDLVYVCEDLVAAPTNTRATRAPPLTGRPARLSRWRDQRRRRAARPPPRLHVACGGSGSAASTSDRLRDRPGPSRRCRSAPRRRARPLSGASRGAPRDARLRP